MQRKMFGLLAVSASAGLLVGFLLGARSHRLVSSPGRWEGCTNYAWHCSDPLDEDVDEPLRVAFPDRDFGPEEEISFRVPARRDWHTNDPKWPYAGIVVNVRTREVMAYFAEYGGNLEGSARVSRWGRNITRTADALPGAARPCLSVDGLVLAKSRDAIPTPRQLHARRFMSEGKLANWQGAAPPSPPASSPTEKGIEEVPPGVSRVEMEQAVEEAIRNVAP